MTESEKGYCALGVDTSNYTTSVALVDEDGKVLADCRKLLSVKPGERGLRQSEALFQHVNNLPDLMEEAMTAAGHERNIAVVAASERPRPVEGSYMPCFLPGITVGKSLATVLAVPYIGTSHQEGHIQALLPEHEALSRQRGFLCFHLSGGTCELLHVTNDDIRIIGGSRDISFGQVLDRIGVSIGKEFPAGNVMDRIAFDRLQAGKEQEADTPGKDEGALPKIRCREGWIDLAGIETAARRALEDGDEGKILLTLFQKMAEAVIEVCRNGHQKTGCRDVLLAGGVSTSRTMRNILQSRAEEENGDSGIRFHMDDSDRGRDNAVGIARIGMMNREASGRK